MNIDQFSYEDNGQRYINPQVALDESNAFIQNLRDTQQTRNAEIAKDTYNLGTAVPSNLGGLSGSGSYFNARYQTPQTNTLVADLKASAQAQALSDVLNNEVAKAKKRYSDAYKAYQKRNSGGGGGGTTTTTTTGDTAFESDDGTVYTYGGSENASTGLMRDDEASKIWGGNVDNGEVAPVGGAIPGFFGWVGDRIKQGQDANKKNLEDLQNRLRKK